MTKKRYVVEVESGDDGGPGLFDIIGGAFKILGCLVGVLFWLGLAILYLAGLK